MTRMLSRPGAPSATDMSNEIPLQSTTRFQKGRTDSCKTVDAQDLSIDTEF